MTARSRGVSMAGRSGGNQSKRDGSAPSACGGPGRVWAREVGYRSAVGNASPQRCPPGRSHLKTDGLVLSPFGAVRRRSHSPMRPLARAVPAFSSVGGKRASPSRKKRPTCNRPEVSPRNRIVLPARLPDWGRTDSALIFHPPSRPRSPGSSVK
jgi:hypothetical protein